jgi:hypothetical protein
MIRPVDTSAKKDETCGFHQLWCSSGRAGYKKDNLLLIALVGGDCWIVN